MKMCTPKLESNIAEMKMLMPELEEEIEQTEEDEHHLAQLERAEKGKLQELQTQIEAKKRKKRKLQDLYHATPGLPEAWPEGGGSTEDYKTWLKRQIAAATRLLAQRRAQRARPDAEDDA